MSLEGDYGKERKTRENIGNLTKAVRKQFRMQEYEQSVPLRPESLRPESVRARLSSIFATIVGSSSRDGLRVDQPWH